MKIIGWIFVVFWLAGALGMLDFKLCVGPVGSCVVGVVETDGQSQGRVIAK